MGSSLWAGRLEESPYQHLLSVDLWGQVRESLVADGSRVSNLSRESILAVAFRVSFVCVLCVFFVNFSVQAVPPNCFFFFRFYFHRLLRYYLQYSQKGQYHRLIQLTSHKVIIHLSIERGQGQERMGVFRAQARQCFVCYLTHRKH